LMVCFCGRLNETSVSVSLLLYYVKADRDPL
jgi:hypothetical protein